VFKALSPPGPDISYVQMKKKDTIGTILKWIGIIILIALILRIFGVI